MKSYLTKTMTFEEFGERLNLACCPLERAIDYENLLLYYPNAILVERVDVNVDADNDEVYYSTDLSELLEEASRIEEGIHEIGDGRLYVAINRPPEGEIWQTKTIKLK